MKCVLFHPLIFAVHSGSTTATTSTTTIITTIRNFSVGVWQYMPHTHIGTHTQTQTPKEIEREKSVTKQQEHFICRTYAQPHASSSSLKLSRNTNDSTPLWIGGRKKLCVLHKSKLITRVGTKYTRHGTARQSIFEFNRFASKVNGLFKSNAQSKFASRQQTSQSE